MSIVLTKFSDEVEYVFREIHGGRHRRIVTYQGIDAVLRKPPKNPKKPTLDELSIINRGLNVAVAEDTVVEVLRLAHRYHKLLAA